MSYVPKNKGDWGMKSIGGKYGESSTFFFEEGRELEWMTIAMAAKIQIKIG